MRDSELCHGLYRKLCHNYEICFQVNCSLISSDNLYLASLYSNLNPGLLIVASDVNEILTV